ncbi:unnamed protein product [Prorocentrum cordatum]|uniref:Uncharacterized protein n=1 Tax=Prorocentrum cordatum TaxID=2364126 RepID=A0ABN9SZZ5_9DINO|nr:unnamed protein product [Polarella glacialis]
MATLTSVGRSQMWALKDIRAHDTFGGVRDEFESYFFTMEAEVTEMGWRHLYDAAVTHVGPISFESITNEETRELSRNLGTFLAMKMRGKAQTMTKLAGAGNGFEALRQIYADYRPQGGTSEHSLLTTTVQPKWWTNDDHSRRSFAEVLHDWDRLVTQCELASQEKISDIMKCATILGYAPLQIRKVLDGASQEVKENCAVMRSRRPSSTAAERPPLRGGRRPRRQALQTRRPRRTSDGWSACSSGSSRRCDWSQLTDSASGRAGLGILEP